MFTFLPEAVRLGLEDARRSALRKSSRLAVRDGDKIYRIKRLWDQGFAIDHEGQAQLRGRVDIYDGPKHLYQCLVLSSYEDGQDRIYEFKWLTQPATQPAADFVRPEFVPAGLLGR